MEAVAAAASVAGLLSLAIQGLKCVNCIREFCDGLTDDAAQDFSRECAMSALILADVKALCLRIKESDGRFRSELRLTFL
jgi:hypothetical protein